jgi:hypothetical protein
MDRQNELYTLRVGKALEVMWYTKYFRKMMTICQKIFDIFFTDIKDNVNETITWYYSIELYQNVSVVLIHNDNSTEIV